MKSEELGTLKWTLLTLLMKGFKLVLFIRSHRDSPEKEGKNAIKMESWLKRRKKTTIEEIFTLHPPHVIEHIRFLKRNLI